MPDHADARVRAVLVLVTDGSERTLGAVTQGSLCDLALVDRLLTLQLVAKRFGMRVRLAEPDADFRAFVQALGFAEVLGLAEAERGGHSSMRGGNPNCAKRSG
jgi:hypothetical protein